MTGIHSGVKCILLRSFQADMLYLMSHWSRIWSYMCNRWALNSDLLNAWAFSSRYFSDFYSTHVKHCNKSRYGQESISWSSGIRRDFQSASTENLRGVGFNSSSWLFIKRNRLVEWGKSNCDPNKCINLAHQIHWSWRLKWSEAK